MNKSDSIINICAAIIAVMKEVKGIEKSMTVGSGNNAYPGVADQDVKKIIGDAMSKNGLTIIPTSITPKIQIDRWESQYGPKQSVFTDVMTTYLLLHTSGEFIEVAGYGHGVDSQDKGAGKATTYALKYALLYTFMVPTGKIDDADSEHSDTKEVPAKNGKAVTSYNHKVIETDGKPLISNKQFKQLIDRVKGGDVEATAKAMQAFSFDQSQINILNGLNTATV